MGNWFDIGSTAIGSGISAIAGSVQGKKNRQHQKEMQEQQQVYNIENMNRQHELNEDAANAADARTRALYNDFGSPEALRRQYEEAGLSVGLMYGGSGASGQNMPHGAQGGTEGLPSVSGAGANPYTGLETLGLQFADIRLKNAEAKEKEVDTKVKEETADVKIEQEGAILENLRSELNEIISRTKLNEESAEYKRVQTTLTGTQIIAQEIQNNFDTKTFETRMKTLGQNLANLKEEWRRMDRENDFGEETYWDGVEQIRKSNDLLLKQIFTEGCKAANYKANTTKAWGEVKKIYKEITTEGWRAKNEMELYKRFEKEWENQMGENAKNRRNQTLNTILHGVFSAMVAMSFFKGNGMKGPKPLMKKQTTVWDGKSKQTWYEYGTE